MKKKETVSLCLIAKDEEKFISSCINSVKHLVDDIVVVDTGSRDQTVKLAINAGARVFNFIWTGDFSRARNFALEQAASDWIMVLDADEVLEPFSIKDFNRLLEARDVEGYFLHIKNYLGTGEEVGRDQVVRMFRNKPAYRFQGAIHEQVAPSILKANGGKGLVEAPLVINHYGYLNTQVLKKDKFNRNTMIINRELKRKPGDPFLLYCLAVEQYQWGNVDEGLDCLEKALVRMRGTEGYFEDVILNIALGLLKTDRTARLIEFTSKSLEMFPECPDLLLLRGLGYLSLGRYLEAAGDLGRVLQAGGSEILPDFIVLCFMGDAYNLSGNYVRAGEAYLSSLRNSNGFLYPLTQIFGLIQKDRGVCGLDKICRFAAARKKRPLWEELLEAGEAPIAAAVLLLSMYDLTTGGCWQVEELAQLGKSFSSILSQLKPGPGRPLSLNYLSLAAQEIYVYAKAIEKGFYYRDFPARSTLKFLLENSLLLLIKEFCPPWTPQPFLRATLFITSHACAVAMSSPAIVENNLEVKSEVEDEAKNDSISFMDDPELKVIRSIIINTTKAYDPKRKDFCDIYRSKLMAECDQVFIERLKKNPSALKMSFWKDHFEIKALKNYPEISGVILDFGCGSGHSDIYLARKGKRVHGIDMSPVGIAIAGYLRSLESTEVKKRLTFSVNDVTCDKPEGLLFDSVWSSHVFEHIPDPDPVLAGLRNWVKKGAYLLIIVPLGFAYDDPGHVHHFFNAEQLKTHLKNFVKVVRVDVHEKDRVLRALCRFTQD